MLTRLWFALLCWLKILFDGAFAARIWAVHRGAAPQLAAAEPSDPDEDAPDSEPDSEPEPEADAGPPERDEEAERWAALQPALQLLALLQREGRLIDFFQQDIEGFDDADIGAAARVVHEGCRKALRAHVTVKPVRAEAEESTVEIASDFDPAAIKLTGKVPSQGPYRGVLRHGGWRVTDMRLPQAVAGHDFAVVAPAEVEL